MERCSDQPSQDMLHAQSLFLTHLLLGILQKIVFLKLIKLFSGHCLATTSQNAVRELSTFPEPSVPGAKYQLPTLNFDHAQKAKFRASF